MAETTQALQAQEKREVSTPAETTRPGMTFTPAVDIFETDKAITLLADMPGVVTDKLNIDLRENTLTLEGDVESPEGSDEDVLFREYPIGKYFRQFTLSEVIDQARIEAALKDGVLRLDLPKVEKATPRKIAVSAA